jgi:hypothetical protein
MCAKVRAEIRDIPRAGYIARGTRGEACQEGKNVNVSEDGFVKMAGFQLLRCTILLLILDEQIGYSGSFLSVFTELECLRRHNFAHFTSSPLEKRVIGHDLLDCGWTEADRRAI